MIDMGKINELKNKAQETAKGAIKKSNELVEMAKYNLAITELQSKVNGCYKKLGELMYDAHSKDAEVGELVQKYCEEIDGYFAEIGSYKEKLASLKNLKSCPACSTDNVGDASFCSACGNPLTGSAEVVEIID